VTKLYPLGFKMLLLGFWDGKTLIATDFSLHREKGQKGTYGLSKKELKSQFRKKREIYVVIAEVLDVRIKVIQPYSLLSKRVKYGSKNYLLHFCCIFTSEY